MSEFSASALAKQAEADRLAAAGERIPLTLMLGMFEPAVQPTDDQRCRCCGLDARPDQLFGGDGRYCNVCIGRGHDEDDQP